MKLWKLILLIAFIGYISINVLDKIAYINWMNPMLNTLVEIRYPQEKTKALTAEEIRGMIHSRSYGYARWPYMAEVSGVGTNWTIRFEPLRLTPWRRIWWAVAHWEFNPDVPVSYVMRSDRMVVECTTEDGRVFLLMNDAEKDNSKTPR